jgi:pimeloyl-ACP methyl ester carboxylesterase
MSAPTHRVVETNGIRMHIAEQGEGPLVLLLHGWPATWYSWRHQISALAEAGYHVVAPDQRGYGGTDAPEAVDQYSIMHLVGDIVGLMDVLGETSAAVIGHDWGAVVAWQMAMMRPDLVTGMGGMSALPSMTRSASAPLETLRQHGFERFYQVYFQQPDRIEADLGSDVRSMFLRGFDSRPSAAGVGGIVPEGAGFLQMFDEPATLPDWLSEADIEAFIEQSRRNGFSGGVNWYRNIDRNWELTAPWHKAELTTPTLYVCGDRDLIRDFPGAERALAGLRALPSLRKMVDLPNCGHWPTMEHPQEIADLLLEFLKGL